MDKLINFGGAVKALGDGRIEGHLVVFGDPDNTDLTGYRDYFTAETDFGIEAGAKTKIWYRHGLNPKLDREIGEGELKVDDVGVWIDGQLNLRDRYVKAVYGNMAMKGALGWSSGSVTHLVRREQQENGAHKITRWPLGLDASVTPDPADPRTQVVTEMKCLSAEPDPLEELPALKSQYLGEHVEREMTMAGVRALNDALMYSVLYRCLYDEELTTEQKRERITGAFAEFASIATETLTSYLGQPEEAAAMKALRTLWGPERPESLADHTAKVVSAAADLTERLASRLEVRKQTGRSLSPSNLAALKSADAALEEVLAVNASLAHVLAEADPGVTPPAPDLTLERDRLRLLLQTQIATCGIN